LAGAAQDARYIGLSRKALSAACQDRNGGIPTAGHRKLINELFSGRGAGRPASALLIGVTWTAPRTMAFANSSRLQAPSFTT